MIHPHHTSRTNAVLTGTLTEFWAEYIPGYIGLGFLQDTSDIVLYSTQTLGHRKSVCEQVPFVQWKEQHYGIDV